MSINLRHCLAAILVAATCFASEPPKGFRSLNWGSTPPKHLKKMGGTTSDGTSLYTSKPGVKPAPFLGLPVVEEAYSYTHGKLYSGSVWLDGRSNFEQLKAALTRTYGEPSFTNERQDLIKWKWAGSKVEVRLMYQSKFSRTEVAYSNGGI